MCSQSTRSKTQKEGILFSGHQINARIIIMSNPNQPPTMDKDLYQALVQSGEYERLKHFLKESLLASGWEAELHRRYDRMCVHIMSALATAYFWEVYFRESRLKLKKKHQMSKFVSTFDPIPHHLAGVARSFSSGVQRTYD